MSTDTGWDDGVILPSISINLSIVIEDGGIWCPPEVVTNEPITEEIIHEIAIAGRNGCLRLEELILNRSGDDDVQAVIDLLEAIPTASSIRRIVITNMYEAGDDLVTTLARFTSLKDVDLNNCRNITSMGLRAGLITPSANNNIETLNLQSTKLDDDGLEILSVWYAHSNSSCTNVISLEAMKRGFDKLKTFKFGANNISDAHVECIAACPTLETLLFSTIGSTKITDDGLKPLGESLINLKILSLNGSFLLGDAGVAHLSSLKKLEYLDLGRTKTSSAAWPFIKLPNLKVLDLYHTEAVHDGDDELDKLHRNKPDLSIIVEYAMDGSKSSCAIVYGKYEIGFDFTGYDIY